MRSSSDERRLHGEKVTVSKGTLTRAQANLSAEEAPAQPRPWVPASHVHGRWPRGDSPSPGAWTRSAYPSLSRVAGARRCGRLRDSSEFGRVRAAGRSWTSPLLVLQAAPGETEAIRVGFVVSKRIGKAVRRNRVRRLLREAMRRVCSRVRCGWDLVIVARSRIVGEALDVVQVALEDVLKRAGLLDGPPVATESPTGGFPFAGEQPSDRTTR